MIKALLWDNDGVLVDTEHLYFRATQTVLAEVGITLELEDHKELNLRQGRSSFDVARDAGLREASIERLRDLRDNRYEARLRDGIELMEGVVETLTCIHGELPMAVVTTTSRENFDTVHEPHDTHRFLEFVLANGDYPRCKPHPDPYLAAAERLGLRPEECLVVEDSERGLLAATRAGMRCLVIPHELTAHGDFSAAHKRLESIVQVPDELARLR